MMRLRLGKWLACAAYPAAAPDQRAAACNAPAHLGIARRIMAVRASAQHRHGTAALRIQCGTVGCHVDARGQAAGDGKAQTRQLGSEVARVFEAAGCWVAAADDGNLRLPQQVRVARHPQRRRCTGYIAADDG